MRKPSRWAPIVGILAVVAATIYEINGLVEPGTMDTITEWFRWGLGTGWGKFLLPAVWGWATWHFFVEKR